MTIRNTKSKQMAANENTIMGADTEMKGGTLGMASVISGAHGATSVITTATAGKSWPARLSHQRKWKRGGNSFTKLSATGPKNIGFSVGGASAPGTRAWILLIPS